MKLLLWYLKVYSLKVHIKKKTCSVYSSCSFVIKIIVLKLNSDAVL